MLPALLETGDWVETLAHHQRYPVCCGAVVFITDCGKYAKVKKKFGTKEWIADCKVSELKFLRKNN